MRYCLAGSISCRFVCQAGFVGTLKPEISLICAIQFGDGVRHPPVRQITIARQNIPDVWLTAGNPGSAKLPDPTYQSGES